MNHETETAVEVTRWQQFAQEVRSKGCNLLKRLDDFPDSILVTGCQRSGTTIVTKILIETEGMRDYRFGNDDELAGALILSGYYPHEPQGRYCFQTTYLNERFHEYRNARSYKLVWILRNPFSVVYSMLYNWKQYALSELFQACGTSLLSKRERLFYKLFGLASVSRIKQACLAYNSKVAQLFVLAEQLDPEQLLIVEYDHLIHHKHTILPEIYRLLNLEYRDKYADKLHSTSLDKARNLSKAERDLIQSRSLPIYSKAMRLITVAQENGNQDKNFPTKPAGLYVDYIKQAH